MAMLDTPEQTRTFASDEVEAGRPDPLTGYRSFRLGAFTLSRDEYFARVEWPAKGQSRSHLIPVDAFLRAMMRDVAWGFFYGWVNFDHVIGTRNHYGKVDLYAGTFNGVLREAGVDYTEQFDTPKIMATFKAVLRDWTNASFDPFAAPEETGSAFGRKHGDNTEAIERFRIATRRMPGLPDDSPLRDDLPVNRQFLDVPQDEPELHPAEGYEGELHAFNLFKYLSRSDVTWNPSVSSVCKASLFCPTTEEFILPVFHGNDRVEWFLQLSDEIIWDVADKDDGTPRARVIMRAGDIAAMPADIRHQGYSTKRSMLLVWENATPNLPQRYESGELKPYPVDF
ncbi:hydroxyquinol 1,2-dioxygenase [Pseudomonas aeruginosa]|uniref:Hydroxyquinol 1,2-dioxygenase n=1 Tax=Pseudomonas aeruginosa TaxID=287 RepID=A0A6A9JXI9_PSEAI|nr:hydroxyquinol 1,2-dioxygenase [Pseudomonas aeruginosa]EJB8383513.1 hydroxyquinol 1,2-dioxygenase [Pseudomonas aeruginosa]KSS11674.1 hydroxyquinol 1,2-dioxygenase [Pseudomonas aeruginosa]MBG4982864.1 hydroxyquinol 1,2-dioxygenase [Pseudomonas aeruginosa]MBG5300552.1 hydroxyquinol 1,2-dioxygenase [Pseudomonas aeruginosa]MBG6711193.1 hydroxyquinol 1,2-dioxygenase [Pseudomonas aeruginosa]